ncbi:hypothetical protein PQX77_004473, partial [Marasmius sp. AFHP31]
VYNKIDSISLELVNKLAHTPNTVVISCELDLNLDYLVDRMWDALYIVKVFTKKRGAHPDLSDPVCMRRGSTIEDVCDSIHRSLAPNFKYALVWVREIWKIKQVQSSRAKTMNGLDDLRGWTLGNNIQQHVDIYLSQPTFQEVKRSFPYLVSKEYASGGGDVPDFVWHIIDDGVPFEINDTGIFVTPFSVHHGRIFSTLPLPAYAPTPTNDPGGDATPVDMVKKMNISGSGSPKPTDPNLQKAIQPYICFGYKIQDQVVYISDVSHIPDSAWSIIRGDKDSKRLPVCVLDCLGTKRHTSHFGLDQSVATAREIGAMRSYFFGFSHRVSHEEYVTITEVLGGMTQPEELSVAEKTGISMLGEGEKIWARPAHDGLRVLIDETGEVRDETY